ncbi:tRNA dimethylallyltransferase [Aquirufa ecclesiirivi]|uniref:tRNA (adenosine(37)-N6)-dimethylallyltransferase n=1 Tax=Aquirufa ecclesiirivi TaxID=2715124 RepID=UPI0022A8B2AC|nr:tRNA (adenosine(37)-N6)-dimethylallyltransferase MiaA [Aquirufa ecclesiirivi]MCZ2472310.1 tRNA dimethylallyltransferase [Aquirufa ecclesiirivi]
MQLPLITILGPTASGKTALAVELARRIGGEIISADSRQLYRRLDIGTGKDLLEYGSHENAVPYHLIDILEVGDTYSVAHFQKDAFDALKEIDAHEKYPILCGGTGLYMDAVLSNYQFSSLPPFLDSPLELDRSSIVFGLQPTWESRRANCSKRLFQRLDEGMIEEVENLLKEGVKPTDLRWLGLEYKWLTDFVEGEISREELEKGLEVAIHQFAKRQMTFFRKMERSGIDIQWIPENLKRSEAVDWMISQLIFKDFLTKDLLKIEKRP